MKKGKIIVVGIGPGEEQNITPAVASALHEADAIVGYKYYFRFLAPFTGDGTQCVDTGMRQERERVQTAFDLAGEGKTVCIVSSGDANIYGMAPLVYEMACEKDIKDIDIEVLPGISAFQQAAALLGAPTGHDFCVVSLSDLLTPWERIERRIRAAAQADFVTAVYNPRSTNRYWQLHRLKEIFLAEGRSGNTPVGHVRNASREGQTIALTTLADFDPDEADMFSVIIIGNSQSYVWNNPFVTPRGYFGQEQDRTAGTKVGQDIMIRSFRTIASELKNPDVPLDHKWALLHTIHTTADFEMEQLLYTDKEAVARLYQSIAEGRVHTIVTDVSMVVSGIRKGALRRLGIDAKCYLNDERATALATSQDITRAQAGIRIAVEEHPDALFAFGNAPTALMELCSLIRKGQARPAGIVAAPVGFVHVTESKHMVKTFADIPKVIIEGRKGGSNLAATLVNAILCYDDARELKPGRDV